MAGARQAFLEERQQHAEQQRRIGTRANEQVLVGHRGGLAAPWINHHQTPAACLQVAQAPLDIRHRHQAAIGGQRVAAEDQHELRVIDIRDWQEHAVPIHLLADQVMRQLIDRGRRETIARLQQAQEVVAMGHQPIVMHAGITLVDRHGLLAMRRLDRRQALGGQGKGLIPANRLPVFTHPAHRLAQAVRVVLDILQGYRLGADMPTAERILGIALDRLDSLLSRAVAGHFDTQATNGFAQVAGTVMHGGGHGPLSCYKGASLTMAGPAAPRQPLPRAELAAISQAHGSRWRHLPACAISLYHPGLSLVSSP